MKLSSRSKSLFAVAMSATVIGATAVATGVGAVPLAAVRVGH